MGRSVLLAHGSHQLEVRSKLPLFDKAGALQVLPPTHSPHLPPHRHLGVFAFVTQALNVAPSEAYPLAPGGCGISLELASGLSFTNDQPCDFSVPQFPDLLYCFRGYKHLQSYHPPFREDREEEDIHIAAVPRFLKLPRAGVQRCADSQDGAISFPSDLHFPATGTGASLHQTAVASRDVTLCFPEL